MYKNCPIPRTRAHRRVCVHKLSQISQTGTTAASSLSASFTYDSFGRRIQSTIRQGSNPAETVQYLYEGAQALGEVRKYRTK